MIIPAILQKDLEIIREEINKVDNFAPLIQLDFADGKLVEGKTFLDLEQILKTKTDAKFELHLMVNDPFPFIQTKNTKISKISAHVEANLEIKKWLNKGKELNYKMGISISPKTDWREFKEVINDVDFVQFLTVIPGKQGQKFQNQVLEEIKTFKETYQDKLTQADGGINKSNIRNVLKTGVNNVVIGSAILRDKNPKIAFRNFERIEDEYRKSI